MKHVSKALLLFGLLSVPAIGQTFTPADIPVGVREHAGSGHLRKGFQVGSLQCSAIRQMVTIKWTSSALENQQPDNTLRWDLETNALGAHIVQTASQELSAKFFPTAACVISDSRILVGGVDKAGVTVVEQWDLTWPKVMPMPSTSLTTGLTHVNAALVQRSLVKKLYSADIAGKRIIQNLCAIRKQGETPSTYIVQFSDSRDVYVGNLSGGPMQLLGSAISTTGVLGKVSGFTGASQTGLMFGDMTSVGYVYRFKRLTMSGHLMLRINAPHQLHVVLVDTNRDGVIDSYLQPTPQEWASQGWASLGNYANWWLN